ncbi:MAG: DUF2062 domain-containing protein [Flavobacteriales bacterium]|nr:DUF2062 domain-containing protein [Flavobacteriales bacterium]
MFRKLKNINLRKFFKEIFTSDSESPAKIASAMSLGVFIAVIPIYGFQSIASVTLSHILKLNKAIVFLATSISWPPMVFALIYASYQTGYLLFNGSFNYSLSLSTQTNSLSNLGEGLYLFVFGSIIFGLLLSSFVWLTTRGILIVVKKK